MRFAPKRDMLYAIVIWSAPAVVLAFLVAYFSTTILAIFVLSILLSWWLWTSTWYEVEGGRLRVRCWIFSREVEIRGIVAVRRTRNLLSSCALARERLEVVVRDGEGFFVSPEDPERFVAELKRFNPEISTA